MADVQMVVVNGVRYRPEDAPKKEAQPKPEPTRKQAARPANKSRSARNKED